MTQSAIPMTRAALANKAREEFVKVASEKIGRVLEVSESRVCQIHGQALVRLRSRMEEWLQGR